MRKPILIAVAAIAIALLATAAVVAQTGTGTVTARTLGISSSPSASSTYRLGETITVQVTFLNSIWVVPADSPRLDLIVGNVTRQAVYASGGGTQTLSFSYTVQSGDLDADGVSVVQNSLRGSLIRPDGTRASGARHGPITNAPGHKVNAAPPPLAFSATTTVAAQTYTTGAAVSLTLPEAAGGTAPLTYTLTAPTSSSAGLPAGLAFDGITRVLSGTTTGWQAAIRYSYTVTDANRNMASLPVDITVQADFDVDDDQLIEVHNLAQLDAIRWDMDGNGDVSNQTSTDQAAYRLAFPPGVAGMGCKAVDHDDSTTTPNQPVCIGYELINDLDFDTDGDGATYTATSTGAVVGDSGDAYYNAGQGWDPFYPRFEAIFDGNGNTISNLFINRVNNVGDGVGLFRSIGQCPGGVCRGEVKNLGLLNVKVIASGVHVGTLAGVLFGGAVTGCYADGGSVYNKEGIPSSPFDFVSYAGGLIGSVGRRGTITGSYADVTVTYAGRETGSAGGLVGLNSNGTVTASYATGDVRSSGGISGGLVGHNTWTVTASYATGDVRSNGGISSGLAEGNILSPIQSILASNGGGISGGLVGLNEGTITASYATGSVYARPGSAGSLVGFGESSPITASYGIAGTPGAATIIGSIGSIGGTGKTMVELQSPTTSTGIYANWSASQWDFGTNREYPAVKHNGVLVPGQRRTSIHADNPNAPVIGEPVVAALHVAGATSTSWQWQSSLNYGGWTNIAGANAATYIPVTADWWRHLRAKVTFTASGRNQTLTTVNTAEVAGAPGASAADAASGIPIVGEKIRFSLSAAGATSPGAWRWKRCDDAAMLMGCKFFVTSSEPAGNAFTEYTPVAGTDSDVGKYLQAYVYYVDSGNNNAWTRAKTPVLGPVAAATTSTTSP